MSLVTRRHEADGRLSEAVYSPCEKYRYSLSRTWDHDGRRLLFVMLNPSKATELLEKAGLSKEDYDKAIKAIRDNPDLKKIFDAAKKTAAQ